MLLLNRTLLRLAKGLWGWILGIVALKLVTLAGAAAFARTISGFLGNVLSPAMTLEAAGAAIGAALLADSGDVVRRHRVLFGVFSHFCVYFGFGNAVGDFHYVADTVVVHVPAEAYLALNAVAVSDCDITHIVSEHCYP